MLCVFRWQTTQGKLCVMHHTAVATVPSAEELKMMLRNSCQAIVDVNNACHVSVLRLISECGTWHCMHTAIQATRHFGDAVSASQVALTMMRVIPHTQNRANIGS